MTKFNCKEVHYYLLLGLSFFLPLPSKMTNLITIALLISGGCLIFNKREFFLRQWKLVLFLSFPYLLPIGALSYTNNMPQGLFVLEKQMSLLVFPIVITTVCLGLERNQISSIFKFFSYGSLMAFFLCLAFTTYNGVVEGNLSVQGYLSHNLTRGIGLHASYLSIFLNLSFFFFFNKVFERDFKWYYPVLMIVILLGIVLLSARVALLSLVVWFVFSGIYLGRIYQQRKLFNTIAFVFFILIGGAVLTNDVLVTKIKEMINLNNEYNLDKTWGGRGVRVLKWTCSGETISSNWFLGVGPGDVQDKLQECYVKNDYAPLLFWPDRKFNAHNQFLQTWLGIGVLGLISILSILTYGVLLAVRNRAYYFLTFLFFFVSLSMVESTLEVNKGIVFFGFFNALLFLDLKRQGNFSN